jgi:hypothetical protein
MRRSSAILALLLMVSVAAAGRLWRDSARQKKIITEQKERITLLERELQAAEVQKQKLPEMAGAEIKKLKTEVLVLRAEVTRRGDNSALVEKAQLENARLRDVAEELQSELTEARRISSAQAQAEAAPAEEVTQGDSSNVLMSMYLRNPELFKRYFPEQYKAWAETNQPLSNMP